MPAGDINKTYKNNQFTVKEDFEEITAAIVKKADKTYVDDKVSGVSGGTGGNTNNLTSKYDFNQQVSGVYTMNRSDLSFTDGQVLKSDGTISTSGSLNAAYQGVTSAIPVDGYTHVNALIFKTDGLAVAALAFYDSGGALISTYSSNSTFSPAIQKNPIPVGTARMIYCYSTDSRADSLSRPRWTYIQLINEQSYAAKQVKTESDIAVLNSRYKRSDALFDPSKITTGKGITAGGIVDDATKFLSRVEAITNADTLYTYGGSGAVYVRFYNASMVFIKYAILNFANPSTVISSIGGLESVAFFQFSDVLTKLDAIYLTTTGPVVERKANDQMPFQMLEHFNNGMINWWKGKVGASTGTSLTGAGYYQKYVRYFLNLARYTNHGVGGTKVTTPANGSGDSICMDPRVNDIDSAADFITFEGGQNDGGVSIGPITLANCDTTTYVGAINVWISKIYYRYQRLATGYYASSGVSYAGVTQIPTARNVRIFLCTPFYVPSVEAEANPMRTKEMAVAVRSIGELWGLPIMDLAAESQLNSGVADVYWGSDRTHPIEDAYRDRLAPVMIGALRRHQPVDYTKANYV